MTVAILADDLVLRPGALGRGAITLVRLPDSGPVAVDPGADIPWLRVLSMQALAKRPGSQSASQRAAKAQLVQLGLSSATGPTWQQVLVLPGIAGSSTRQMRGQQQCGKHCGEKRRQPHGSWWLGPRRAKQGGCWRYSLVEQDARGPRAWQVWFVAACFATRRSTLRCSALGKRLPREPELDSRAALSVIFVRMLRLVAARRPVHADLHTHWTVYSLAGPIVLNLATAVALPPASGDTDWAALAAYKTLPPHQGSALKTPRTARLQRGCDPARCRTYPKKKRNSRKDVVAHANPAAQEPHGSGAELAAASLTAPLPKVQRPAPLLLLASLSVAAAGSALLRSEAARRAPRPGRVGARWRRSVGGDGQGDSALLGHSQRHRHASGRGLHGGQAGRANEGRHGLGGAR